MPSTSKVRVRLWFMENFDFYVGALGLCPLEFKEPSKIRVDFYFSHWVALHVITR